MPAISAKRTGLFPGSGIGFALTVAASGAVDGYFDRPSGGHSGFKCGVASIARWRPSFHWSRMNVFFRLHPDTTRGI